MRSSRARTILPLLALLALTGCVNPVTKKSQSLLKPPPMSPDAVVLDVFFVRFPFGNAEANDQLWQEVDEQHLPAELRKRLAHNGFRAGLVGGQLPTSLASLLELKDAPPPTASTELPVTELASEPRVERRQMPLRPGVRGEIIASEVYPQLPVLISEPGELCGQTYSQAQGMLAVTARPEADGRVRLEVVPELHHGQPRQRWLGDQGILRLDAGRPKRAFDQMGVAATLAPGEMLLLSSLPNRPGSLGHHFFTAGEGHRDQKLLVIRLAQTQHNPLFSPPEE